MHYQSCALNDKSCCRNVFVSLPVHNIDHALGVRVTVVRVVGRTLVNHGLVNGVGSLVGEDAGRQARNDLLDLLHSNSTNGREVWNGVRKQDLFEQKHKKG